MDPEADRREAARVLRREALMPRVDELYDWLARDVRPEANVVLAAALPFAEAEYAERIASILIERRHDSAWAGLVGAFDRLPEALQARVLQKPELVRVGLAAALRDAQPALRCGALLLMTRQLHVAMASRAVECLFDADPRVADAAAAALWASAEMALSAAPQVRRQMAGALLDAARRHEQHQRHDLLQACLWYARDLGPALWSMLGHVRNGAAIVVERNLSKWDSPRMATFLLIGMAAPAWRACCEAILRRWSSAECGRALLAQSEAVNHDAIRAALSRLERPSWFIALCGEMEELTPNERARLPHWLTALNFPEDERLRVLRSWILTGPVELRNAAAHALASQRGARAAELLEEIASDPSPAGRFAAWHLAGRKAVATAAPGAAVGARAAVPGGRP